MHGAAEQEVKKEEPDIYIGYHRNQDGNLEVNSNGLCH